MIVFFRVARGLKSLSHLISIAIAHASEHGMRSTIAQTLRFVSDQLHRDQPNHFSAIEKVSKREQPPAAAASRIFKIPRVTIVADLGLQQCTKYRVAQKVELLTRLGIRVFVAGQSDYFRAKSYLQVSTGLIFYRARFSAEFRALVTEARRCGVKTYYDLDDPIFSPEIYAGNSNLLNLTWRERKGLVAHADKYRAAMAQADVLIASTPQLARAMEFALSKPAFLWRNLLDDDMQSLSATILSEAKRPDRSGFTIFYGSGSRAHDVDFGQISQVLRDFLEEFAEAKLHLYGHLGSHQTKNFPEARVQISPFSSYRDYLRCLADADVSVIPLELSEFNQCKSVVRFLDASAVNVPSIASACGDYKNIPEGAAGLTLCSDQKAWASALKRIADMPCAERALLGERARSWVLARMSTKSEAIDGTTLVAPELLQSMGISTA